MIIDRIAIHQSICHYPIVLLLKFHKSVMVYANFTISYTTQNKDGYMFATIEILTLLR